MPKFIFVLLAILSLGIAYEIPKQSPIVQTPLGPIKGSIAQTVLGKTIYAFRGIRYAKPPIDQLRFKPPVPVDAWTTLYSATDNGAACPQLDVPGASEDCLFLNVFSTKLQNAKRPVFVFIHPGGFYSGRADNWGRPDYFLDHEIVLVIIQYRLGSLGFISTGDHLAPGNNGFKDQVLALKWVQKNIASFGGDPNLVTIAGYSCGGSSVSVHMVSPMSRGLFHRGIIMSGSSLGNWPVDTHQFYLAQIQARLVGCPTDTSANIMNCLKTKSAQELGDSLYNFDEFGYEPIMKWLPVIEPDFGQERFLTENPIKSVQCGKFEQIPVITTVTHAEFAAQTIYVLENATLIQQLNENFEEVAPIAFVYERDTENSKHISKELKKFYFGNIPIGNQTRSGLEKIYADGIIGFTVHRAAELLASKCTKDVFYYHFNYRGRFSHYDVPRAENPFGVVHHDDLLYLFHHPFFPRFNISDLEYTMVTKLTTLFANFAKTGNPTPIKAPVLDNLSWEPYNVKSKKYLDIGDKLIMKDHLFKERYEVWDKLFPIPTCGHK